MTARFPLCETNMKHLLFILLTAILCATASAQSIRSLGYNSTNGNVVANTGTNVSLTFTNEVVRFASGDLSISNQSIAGTGVSFSFEDGSFDAGGNIVREQLGFSTNLNTLWTATNASNARSAVGLGATWLTNTNVTNFRTAIGLGATNDVVFENIQAINIYATGATNFPVIDLDDHALFSAVTSNTIIDFSGTNVFFAAPIVFNNTTNASATRTNLGLGATWLTNTNVTNFRTAIGLGSTNSVVFSQVEAMSFSAQTNVFEVYKPIWIGDSTTNDIFQFELGSSDQAKARTNFGLGLPALTNTSNVTMMRALSGSTNTNHPYSGSISVTGTNNTNTLVFSNGILQSVQ